MPAVGLERTLPDEARAVACNANQFRNKLRHHGVVAPGRVVVGAILETDAVGRIGDYCCDTGECGQDVEAIGVIERGVADGDALELGA
mgnify:CR=1 FL=1